MNFIKLSFLGLIVLFSGCTDSLTNGDISIEDPESLIIVPPAPIEVAGRTYQRFWTGNYSPLGSVKLTFTRAGQVKTVWSSSLGWGQTSSHYSIDLTPGRWDYKAEKSGYTTYHSSLNVKKTHQKNGVLAYKHLNVFLKKKIVAVPL